MLDQTRIHHLISTLRHYEIAGGPRPDQYEQVSSIFDEIAAIRHGETHTEAIFNFRQTARSFSSIDTMHGFVCRQPHGYAGDFEIIDRIYQLHHSSDENHIAWDRFFHSCDAPRAVRERKNYSITQFRASAEKAPDGARILNVASGPCRDVLEFKSLPGKYVQECYIHCIDVDPKAIEYARTLLGDCAERITFENKNIFRTKLKSEFDLVWCAGLFDYLDDRRFVYLLRKLYSALRTGGELVVGNFGEKTQSKGYMAFGDWNLNYRSSSQLLALAEHAGLESSKIRIGWEDTGTNLFMHVRA